MDNSGSGWPKQDYDGLIRETIRAWRDGLIYLTGSNRLLNFRPSRTSALSVVRPAPSEVLARVSRDGLYRFRPLAPSAPQADLDAGRNLPHARAEAPPPTADMLDTDKSAEDLAATLRSLYRRSNQDYLDRGVWVLHLTFGALVWSDVDGSRYTSPLLLVPVKLDGVSSAQGPQMKRAEGDPVVNPALTLKLSQHGIQLPRVDDLEDVNLDRVLETVQAAVADRVGWEG